MPADTFSPKTVKAVKATTKSLDEAIADESLTTLQQTSDTFNHAGAECLNIASGNIAAIVESGTLASQFVSRLGKAYVEACNASMHSFSDISRDAISCRTPADFADLQKRAMDMYTGAFSANRKLCEDLFGSYTKTFEPLIACTAYAPERLFTAIAD